MADRDAARTGTPRSPSSRATRRPVFPVAAVTRIILSLMVSSEPVAARRNHAVRTPVHTRSSTLTGMDPTGLISTDPLTDLLNGVRTSGAVFHRSALTGSWAARFEDGSPLAITVLVRGSAWITPQGGAPVRLGSTGLSRQAPGWIGRPGVRPGPSPARGTGRGAQTCLRGRRQENRPRPPGPPWSWRRPVPLVPARPLALCGAGPATGSPEWP